MLKEYRIDDNGNQILYDKEQAAIARLKGFEDLAIDKSPDGYYVCDSGGKDSLVIVDLCIKAGVKCNFHHNLTTLDHYLTVRYVIKRKKKLTSKGYKYEIHIPPKTVWTLIEEKGLPTIVRRWCCQELKEGGGTGRCIVTGVRWAESVKRKGRGLIEAITPKIKDKVVRNNDNTETRQSIESCPAYDKLAVNPIIDWSDADVWEYIHKHKLPYNPLYDMGYKRVGCVGCPMSTKRKSELSANPFYLKKYRKHAEINFNSNKEKYKQNYGWENVDDMMNWWLNGKGVGDQNQTDMWE